MHVVDTSGADLLGERKWMWKLNHIINCTTEQRSLLGSHTDETGRRERNTVWKTKKSICVCLTIALYVKHVAHEFLVDWQNEGLAMKMVTSPSPVLFLCLKKENIKTNNYQWALQCCHTLCSTYRPRRRQCATTPMKPSYFRHSTGNNLKQLCFVFPSIPSLLLTVTRVEDIMHHLRRESVVA